MYPVQNAPRMGQAEVELTREDRNGFLGAMAGIDEALVDLDYAPDTPEFRDLYKDNYWDARRTWQLLKVVEPTVLELQQQLRNPEGPWYITSVQMFAYMQWLEYAAFLMEYAGTLEPGEGQKTADRFQRMLTNGVQQPKEVTKAAEEITPAKESQPLAFLLPLALLGTAAYLIWQEIK